MRSPLLLAVAFLGLAACDGGSPGVAAAGLYRADRFAVTVDGATGDYLAAGGQFDMTLTADGRFEATIDAPDVPEIDGDDAFSASFDGTYSLSGDEVVFFHSEDVFVRDVDWTIEDGVIRTTDALGNGARFDIALRRQ